MILKLEDLTERFREQSMQLKDVERERDELSAMNLGLRKKLSDLEIIERIEKNKEKVRRKTEMIRLREHIED